MASKSFTLVRRYGFQFADLLRHVYVVGGSGHGKTNFMLRLILQLAENQSKHPCAIILLDPHGDASLELARTVGRLSSVTLLDPDYVSYSLNPLELSPYQNNEEKRNQIQARVGELLIFLADVMRTDPERASRLRWIFVGSLHFLYSLGDVKKTPPTFRDLYFFVMKLMSMRDRQAREMLGRKVDNETVKETMKAIAALGKDAFPPVLNRLARFVLPSDSLPARTFCSRNSTVDIAEMLEPGSITILRIPKIHDLPEDYRELLASSWVLKLFFAVQLRASRLEKEGKDPHVRIPVFLFIDEFQTVEKLQTLETILSEARKFGLSLVLAHQYTSQISNRPLLDSILQNAGVVAVGGVRGNDAKIFGDVLGKEFAGELDQTPMGWFTIRIRPYRFGEPTRTERWPISKIPDPIRLQNEVISYMKTDMEKKYGGAVEDKNLIYEEEIEEMLEAEGSPLLPPRKWIVLYWLYKNRLNELLCTDREMYTEFLKRYGWDSTIVVNTLNELIESSYVTARTDYLKEVYKGKDKEGHSIHGPPTTQDEKERARVITHMIVSAAVDKYFSLKIHSMRAGKALHLYTIKKVVEKYWELRCWCTVDLAEYKAQRPDIIIFKPVKIRDAKKGVERIDPDEWGDKTPIEVEVSPRKNWEQVRENYEKNVREHPESKPLFYVTLEEQMVDILHILADKKPGSFEVQHIDIGLPRKKIEEELAEEETADEGKQPEHAEDGGKGGSAAENPSSPTARAERLVEQFGKRILETPNYYSTLGLPSNAKTEDIMDSVRLYLSTYHPDVYPKPEATAITRRLIEIRDTLTDPAKRKEYDKEIGIPEPYRPPPPTPETSEQASPTPEERPSGGQPKHVEASSPPEPNTQEPAAAPPQAEERSSETDFKMTGVQPEEASGKSVSMMGTEQEPLKEGKAQVGQAGGEAEPAAPPTSDTVPQGTKPEDMQEEKEILDRIASDFMRREVSKGEKAEMLSALAELGWDAEKISEETGLALRTVYKYMPKGFKKSRGPRGPRKEAARRAISEPLAQQAEEPSSSEPSRMV